MSVVRGASLSLRCDHGTSPQCRGLATFTAVTMPECRTAARAVGWAIRGTKCVCSPCLEGKT